VSPRGGRPTSTRSHSRVRPPLLRVAVAAILAVSVAACSAPNNSSTSETEGVALAQSPPGAPARFAFGKPADSALVALWARDVRPDGAGLPPGKGSASQGKGVYLAHCAMCHGPTGTEGPAPPLVGGDAWGKGGPPKLQTIGSYWPYATTLFDYIPRAMPQNAPGSLTADETYAVIAWLLASNGIVSTDAVLDASTLPAVRMPARDRFVRDNRRGGPEIR